MSERGIYGVLGEFPTSTALAAAARRARCESLGSVEAYSPLPLEGVDEALAVPAPRVPRAMLAGGLTGAVGGFVLQSYAAVADYPINVGGRPLFSWPAFVPISAELCFLGAAVAGFAWMLGANRLPRYNHPVFAAPRFERSSQDGFYLCIRPRDAEDDPVPLRRFLHEAGARRVADVPS